MHLPIRYPLPQPLMGSGLIEVDNISFEKPAELLLMQNQEMIQAFSPHASQKAFVIWHLLAAFGRVYEAL
jgi:hypothetical protein